MVGRPWFGAREAALGAAVVVALHAGVAQAKSWARWAPAPLASDSSYAAMSARPSDSLSASQSLWLSVQRDWRAQRDEEERSPASRSSVTSPVRKFEHRPRRTDARFAALASRPYAGLTDSEQAWLVAENAAQQAARGGSDSSQIVGGVLLGVLAGVVVGSMIVASAWSHSHWL